MKLFDKKYLDEILNLQKTAFKPEAVKHNDLKIPPMMQTIDDIYNEFDNNVIFFIERKNGKIIGSVRAYIDNENSCHISRLAVHPDFQNRGIGTSLIKQAEFYFKNCINYKIFTGEKSTNVIKLYKKLGYKIIHRKNRKTHFTIHMIKQNT